VSSGHRTSRRDLPRLVVAARDPHPFRPARARPSSSPPPLPIRPEAGEATERRQAGSEDRCCAPGAPGRRRKRELEGSMLARRERTPQACRGERPEQHEAVPRDGHAGWRQGPSNGFTRTGPPGAKVSGLEPSARASAPYSPFGSSTATCRPKAACRSRYVFTSALFPRPIWPSTVTFGFVTTPAAYSSNGSWAKGPPARS